MSDDYDRRLDRLDQLADTAENALRDLRAEIAMLHAVRLNTAVGDHRLGRVADVAPLSHPNAGAGPDAA